jgi:hypothetical protein
MFMAETTPLYNANQRFVSQQCYFNRSGDRISDDEWVLNQKFDGNKVKWDHDIESENEEKYLDKTEQPGAKPQNNS